MCPVIRLWITSIGEVSCTPPYSAARVVRSPVDKSVDERTRFACSHVSSLPSLLRKLPFELSDGLR